MIRNEIEIQEEFQREGKMVDAGSHCSKSNQMTPINTIAKHLAQ